MTTRLLTQEEWDAAKPPFLWMEIENKRWSKEDREAIRQWLGEHCGAGWVFHRTDQTRRFTQRDFFAFSSPGDAVMFELWIRDDPFA